MASDDLLDFFGAGSTNTNTNTNASTQSTKPPLTLHLSIENEDGSPAPSSPSPRAGDTVLTPTDPLAAFNVPDWYGHSLYSPVESNDTADVWGFVEIAKKPNTQGDDKAQSPTPQSTGLIAPPRSKDQKSPRSKSPRSKKAASPSPRPGNFSFAVHFADGADPVIESPVATKEPKVQKEGPKDMSEDFDMMGDLVGPPSDESQPKKQSSIPSNSPTKAETGKKEANKAKTEDKTKTEEKATESKPEAESGKKEEKKTVRTDAVAEMKRGTAMLKYGRRGFPHFRRFQLSDDMTRLVWYSRRKGEGETSIAIADIKEILEGQQTEVFKQCTQSSLEKASFSIVYGNKMKTLDLVAKSYEEAKLWTKGLRGLVKANQQGKLHKVAQILVNVDYTDITKPNYRGDKNSQIPATGYDNTELLHAVESTLEQSKKTFKQMQELMRNSDVQKSKEYDATKLLMSELEQRFDDLEFALTHRTLGLQSLKRDVWVLKVDVTVLHDKLLVLGKSKFSVW